MEYIEITAKTVNEAITKACMQLGIPSDRLDIQVISEGSKGFLGIGNKPAIIKVAEKTEASEKIVEEEIVKEEVFEEETVVNEADSDDEVSKKDDVEKEKTKNQKNKKKDSRRKNNRRSEEFKDAEIEKKVVVEEPREPLIKTEEEIAARKESAGNFLKDVFAAMEITAQINMEYVPESGSLDIDFEGDDMGVLIGKRGQTLDSLQYLTSLVVNKGQKDYIRVKLDTEDYRRRRKETLENLAKNIASKVKKTRKPVVLEPMNPYERRIIHSALQPNKYVETYSDGNEPYRHIVVAPRKRKEQD